MATPDRFFHIFPRSAIPTIGGVAKVSKLSKQVKVPQKVFATQNGLFVLVIKPRLRPQHTWQLQRLRQAVLSVLWNKVFGKMFLLKPSSTFLATLACLQISLKGGKRQNGGKKGSKNAQKMGFFEISRKIMEKSKNFIEQNRFVFTFYVFYQHLITIGYKKNIFGIILK